MARGHEETSTSQVGRKRGTSREMPTISSLVATMSVEELRSFSQVPTDIRLEVANGPTAVWCESYLYFGCIFHVFI